VGDLTVVEATRTGGAPVTGTRVLVVDDEVAITELVAAALRYEGFSVRTAACGADALVEARRFDPQLMVLDLMLPDMDGSDVFRRAARPRDIPCIFLTARDGPQDTVRGLTLGADDYITKPFSLEELVARIRTVLRRAAGPAPERRVLVVGDLELDDDARVVTVAGRRADLTPTEFTLLRYLMQNAGRVMSKRQILDHVWAYDFGGQANIVEIYVSYLRRKLGRHTLPQIETVRGFGYVLRRPGP
jgi:two-component system, OmpR family, response regulator